MKKIFLLVLGWGLVASSVQAAETPAVAPEPATKSLEDQLSDLETPGNQAPAGVTSERLYAVQNRFAPLRHRHEFNLGGAGNFSANAFLNSRSIEGAYRFYLSDRWYLDLAGSFVFNDFTREGEWVQKTFNRPPDVAVVKYRADLGLGYHLFYGKLRFTMDHVVYFDQYVALGPGLIVLDMAGGNKPAGVLNAGIAFWFGQNFSLRLGMKDYIFNEQRQISSSWVNNFVGYLQAGYVFGG